MQFFSIIELLRLLPELTAFKKPLMCLLCCIPLCYRSMVLVSSALPSMVKVEPCVCRLLELQW